MHIKIIILQNQKTNYRLYFEKKYWQEWLLTSLSSVCPLFVKDSWNYLILWTENFAKVNDSLYVA